MALSVDAEVRRGQTRAPCRPASPGLFRPIVPMPHAGRQWSEPLRTTRRGSPLNASVDGPQTRGYFEEAVLARARGPRSIPSRSPKGCAMRFRGVSIAFALCLVCGARASGQSATARIETVALRLTEPDPYQVKAVLEPARRVRLVAPADGMIRGVEARLGVMVRESQDLVHFDPAEANARYRLAAAELRARLGDGQKPESDPARLQYEAARDGGRANQGRPRSLHRPGSLPGPRGGRPGLLRSVRAQGDRAGRAGRYGEPSRRHCRLTAAVSPSARC